MRESCEEVMEVTEIKKNEYGCRWTSQMSINDEAVAVAVPSAFVQPCAAS